MSSDNSDESSSVQGTKFLIEGEPVPDQVRYTSYI